MRRPAQRFGILVLALALVPGQRSTADAGVIPWLYDAVFGPVRHYGYGGSGYVGTGYVGTGYVGTGYGGYSTAYRYPYAAPRISYAVPTYSGRSNCGPTGCGPAGCATTSYSVGYRPTYCSTGRCSTVLSAYRYSAGSCGACSTVASANSPCAAKTAWKSKESKEAKTEWPTEVITSEAAVPTPAAQDEAPKPKTFADEPADPANGQPVAVEKVVGDQNGGTTGGGKAVPGDPNWTETGKPATAVVTETPAASAAAVAGGAAAKVTGEEAATKEKAAGDAGFGETLRDGGEDVNKIFAEPVKGVEEAVEGEAAPTTTPLLPDGPEGLPKTGSESELEQALPLELDKKSSWKFEVPVQRIAFRAGFRRAKLARTTVSVDVDYVVPAASTLRLVSR